MKKLIYLALLGIISTSNNAQELNQTVQDSSEETGLVSFMRSDIPKNAPKFEDYRVPVYKGKLKSPDVKSHPRSSEYRTTIRNAAKSGVDFAGHYSIATWGCGTSCTGVAIIDVKSGKVYHPSNLETTSNWNLANSDLTEDQIDLTTALNYRKNSNLLVVMGHINEEVEKPLGTSYFSWDGGKLRLIDLPSFSRTV